MVRTHTLDSDTRPQPARILAIAATIAVHVLAFLLLLIPMSSPPMQVVFDRGKPQILFLEPRPPVVLEPLPITRAAPQIQRPAPERTLRTAPPALPTPVIVEGGSLATSTQTAQVEGVVETGPAIAGPVAATTLAYLSAPPPPYPREAVLAGVQGSVLLKVLVDVDGKPLQVTVEQSSGSRVLDRAAREHVLRRWRFQPAMQDGRTVQALGLVPIAFSMQ